MAPGEYHEGQGVVRASGKNVLLLCPFGHLVSSIPQREWAGSYAEATWPTRVVRCYGSPSQKDVE